MNKTDAATRAGSEIVRRLGCSRYHSAAHAAADIIRQHTRPDLGVKLASSLLGHMGLREDGKPWAESCDSPIYFDEPESIYSRTVLLELRDLARQYLNAVGECATSNGGRNDNPK